MFHFWNTIVGLRCTHVVLFFLAAMIAGCSAHSGDAEHSPRRSMDAVNPMRTQKPDVTWAPLIQELTADGFDVDMITMLFSRVGKGVSLSPMGAKAYELYRARFLLPKLRTHVKSGKSQVPSVYKDVITAKNIEKAKIFCLAHKKWLHAAYGRFGVSPEVIIGLLMVETRLGTYLGRFNAFEILASMSASRDFSVLLPYMKGIEPAPEEREWLEKAINKKADWAYLELKALIEYCLASATDPLSIPSSIYGAVGICQFMPSNINVYGCDGDGDGLVDLFIMPDAIASVAKYLKEHGWKESLPHAGKMRILRKYNNSVVYANTILTFAEKLEMAE